MWQRNIVVKRYFFQILLFRQILYFHTCKSFISFFNRIFIGHTCKFLTFFLCIFIQKICCRVFTFYFCKFSLDPIYSFHMYNSFVSFYHNVYLPLVLFFKFLFLVFLQKKFFVQFYFFANLVT